MLPRSRVLLALVGVLCIVGTVHADLTSSLKPGTLDLKFAGPLAFGPDGVLFVGDTTSAAIYAIDTSDKTRGSGKPLNVDAVNEKIASLLGTDAQQILINDMAVNPASGSVYFSVSRGKGPDAKPAIVRFNTEGKLEEFAPKTVKFAKVALPNPSAKSRAQSITDIAFVDGRVIVAGLSNEDFASTLRAIPFPFNEADKGTGVEIYHGAHGKVETHAPVRTLTTYAIAGQECILAAYTCTPLVQFPIKDLKAGAKVKGKTIAELGNGNAPLDMFVYKKDGKDWLLIANSKRGVMKVSTEGMDKLPAIEARTGVTGAKYETIKEWQGVVQLDRFNDTNAIVLIQGTDGKINLKTMPLP
jgi:hypothetical protein